MSGHLAQTSRLIGLSAIVLFLTCSPAFSGVLDKGPWTITQGWLIGLTLAGIAWFLARWDWWTALIYWFVPALWGWGTIFMFYDSLMGDAIQREAPRQNFLGDWVLEGAWVVGIVMIALPPISAYWFWRRRRRS